MWNNPYALMGLQLVLWGSYAAVSKLALEQTAVWPCQCYSFATAFLTLAIPYFSRNGLKKLCALTRKDLLWLVAIACPSFLYYFFYTTALSLTSAVQASVLNYTFPLFVILLAWPICGEKLTAKSGLAAILGFLGTVIVLFAGHSPANLQGSQNGAIYALCGAVCWAVFSNLGRKSQADNETANLVYMAVGFLLSLLGMLISGEDMAIGGKQLVCVIWNGVFSLAAGYFIWFRILAVAPVALAANLSFLTPFANLLFIALLLREPIYWQHWAGLLVILLGVFLQSASKETVKK